MYRLVSFFIILLCISAAAQTHRQPGASEIKLRLKKLNFLGSVLYVAAHPDDENTRAISFFVSDQLAATAYLAMTRGDGGQNLIGTEIRDQLGLIRTQELLAARRIDGGQQFFTRANDFGFSKNVNETLEIWSKDEVLSDVVRVYRQFQPDVVIDRFPPNEQAGHGHHTASAVLAQEAFDKSGDINYLPAQVKELGVWQPKRLFTNTGRWWNQTVNENTPDVVTVNVGTYNTLLGKSYAEIAADSRTQHKSQGFGSSGRRGDALEFFEFVKGEKASKSIFDGVNTTWSRIKGGESITPMVEKAITDFKDEDPSASIPQLLKIQSAIRKLPESVWKTRKEKEVGVLIQDCLGLYVEATANYYWSAPGEKIKVSLELINRSKVSVSLTKIQSTQFSFDSTCSTVLSGNIPLTLKTEKTLNNNLDYSDPYWLKKPHTQGLFTVENPALIGQPENLPAVSFDFTFLIGQEQFQLSVPFMYKWTDPVRGELNRPFYVVPPVLVNFDKPDYLFNSSSPNVLNVLVKSTSGNSTGSVGLLVPAGWRVEPATYSFDFKKKEEEKLFAFKVFPGAEEGVQQVEAVAKINGTEYNQSMKLIQYDHIPTQIMLPTASAKVVRLNLKKEGNRIAYIMGAGDEIPLSLRNMGYDVWEMADEEITPTNLKKVDAVVLGVRILNTSKRIRFFMPDLLDYVKQGGTLVMQYNNNFELHIDADRFSPFPLTLSRDRVTQEGSPVRILKPDHPLLNFPNKISDNDFNGWVQERGLYFPSKWAPEFDALLSMNDANEPPRDGSLLVAKYGQGYFVYTALSFFRELPEGVPGAYKLFANIVSIGKGKSKQVGVNTKTNGR
ncbi:MAG: PIG-L family deacetylase [Bacteroidetes bacterium]|nr:PIG-L family deacetylase [Bacteroidota bacterium]MBS1541736.1 PIG-L family deacetylase [Bacteroidota bacterium]